MRFTRAVTTALLAFAFGLVPAANAAAGKPAACENLFSQGSQLVCVTQTQDHWERFAVATSHDGSTWHRGSYVAASVDGPVFVDDAHVSSSRVTIAIRQLGVYASTDGHTLTLTDPLPGSSGAPLPTVVPQPGVAGGLLAIGSPPYVGVVKDVGQTPVAGVGAETDAFFSAKSAAAIALGRTTGASSLGLFRCTGDYSCTSPIKKFPAGASLSAFFAGPTFAVFVTKAARSADVWWWDGRKLVRELRLSRAATAIYKTGAPRLSVGAVRTPNGKAVVRLQYDVVEKTSGGFPSLPADCLYAGNPLSDTWTRFACARNPFQQHVAMGQSRSAPWTANYSVSATPAGLSVVGQRVVAVSGIGTSGTLWATPDFGRHWKELAT